MRVARLAVALNIVSALLLPLAAAGDDLRLVVGKEDGSHAAAQLPLTDAQLDHAKSVWAWTAQLPPRKVDLRQIAQQREAIVAELRRLPARPLEVRLRGWSRPEELASLRVIAAPAEMWASVPEPLLPAFPISKEGRVTINIRDPARIRVVGEGFGTTWEQVTRTTRSIEIQLRRPAADANPTFRLSDGSPAARLFAMVMTRRKSDPRWMIQAQFTSDDKGSMRIPSLPDSEVIALFIRTDRSAPQVISGTAAELSRVIPLPASARIRGKFVDEKNRPLTGVNVKAEGWVSPDAPASSRADAVSDEAGQWVVQGLPRVDVIVRASAAQRSTFRKRVSLQQGDVDLGTVPLVKSTPVLLTVSDAAKRPLANVTVESDSGFKGRTDREGTVTLTGLAVTEENSVTVTASGFVKQTIHLAPPLPKKQQVVLEGAFSLRGTVVTDSGEPVSDGTAVVTVGPGYRNEIVNSDGTFAFEVQSDEDFGLTFESPTAASVTRKEPKGRAGETRDLGTIRLPSGRSVHGRITDSASAPVNGARIWALRPAPGGAVTAWAAGRIVQASSDAEGLFDVRGLTPGPALLRIDAPDFARAYRDVLVDENAMDLGVIELARGQTVAVKAGRADAAVARLDLRGNSLDADMLTAPVVVGEAHLRHVPAGRYKVTVLSGNAVVCDRNVDVNDTDVSVECAAPMTVSGRVLLGGAPASGGTLTWVQPSQTDGLIQTTSSPLGAIQQRVYGLGGGIVSVLVQSDGTFETNQLRPGDWQVGWRSADSVGTPDRLFTIPDAAEAQIVVEFSGSVIRGRVLDQSNDPVPGARVREIQGPLYSMAAPDGSFAMTAVPPGIHRLQASLAGRASAVADVRVEAGKQAPDVVLQIGDAAQKVLSVRVVGIDGEPKPNAFVFVELTGGIIKTVTADANGVATTSVAEGLPELTRLVAFAGGSWAFGEFRHEADDPGPYQADVRFTSTGALRIRSATVSGTPVLLAPQVPGDLAWMLARIGTFVSVAPQSPLVVNGLPAGTYEVRVGSEQMVGSVTAGSTATIDLP
ncbi:MAG: carboxypeptidase-like regulatory domain-containing protein [Acidobacteriota bacterium]|nr:carboxypeptidase-like regulatory domain-containing protein [Acidobacteriota bacterium]